MAKKTVTDALHTFRVPVEEDALKDFQKLAIDKKKSMAWLIIEAVKDKWGVELFQKEAGEAR